MGVIICSKLGNKHIIKPSVF